MDHEDERAWLWLATVATDPDEQPYCLNRALVLLVAAGWLTAAKREGPAPHDDIIAHGSEPTAVAVPAASRRGSPSLCRH